MNPQLPSNVNIDTLARDNIRNQIGQGLMDLDKISNSIVDEIPNTSHELSYKLELKFNTRVYIFLCFLGFLMFMSIIITSIK